MVKKKKKRDIHQLKLYSLPVHTYESHPCAKSGVEKQTFIIAIIAVALIIILSILALFSSQFAGKAISFGENRGSTFDVGYNSEAGEVVINVSLVAGKSISGVYLEMTPVICNQFNVIDFTNELNWGFEELSCEQGTTLLKFGDATLGDGKSGDFNIAKLKLILPAGGLTLSVNPLDVYDSETGEDLISGGDTFICQNNFCIVPPPQLPPVVVETGPSTLPSGGGGSSGGGGGGGGMGSYSHCQPQWDCGVWTVCNISLQQRRVCTDKKACQPNKVETRSCKPCDEYWTCGSWSACYSGKQTRTCLDEHACETAATKPAQQRACAEEVVIEQSSYQPPVKIERTTPKQIVQKPVAAQKPAPSKYSLAALWKDYSAYLVGIPSALILIITLIFVIVHFAHPSAQQRTYNLADLKNWIVLEQKAGTPNVDIKQILVQQTGWSEAELGDVFKELAKEQTAGAAVTGGVSAAGQAAA